MEKTPKVNIITENGSWILRRIAQELSSIGTVSTKPIEGFDIYYFVNYALARKFGKQNGINVGFFTHKDEEYIDNWIESEKICDIGVYMADRYKPECKITAKIYPTGLDYIGLNPRLKVGLAGRIYKNGRKGDDWIADLVKIKGLEWYALGDDSWEKLGDIKSMKWQSDKQAKMFYEFIDVLVCASTLEGGPVPIVEAIKCGTPVISRACGNYEIWSKNTAIVKTQKEMRVELERMRDAKLERYDLTCKDWNWFRNEHIRLFNNV